MKKTDSLTKTLNKIALVVLGVSLTIASLILYKSI